MKNKYLPLLCLLVSLTTVAQTVGEAFYIYRNDGGFNAFFRDEVDSIAYSHFDTDSIYYDENVTQLVYTADSLYRIPLAVIDSVGFVQPEIKYREGTVPLEGCLFDYLIKAEDMLLTFSPQLPAGLMPKVDDKIVATAFSEKLPNGFVGKVRLVESGASGIAVLCDSLALEDAVSQFYSVMEIVSSNGSSTRRYLNRKAPVETNRWPLDFNLPEIVIPIDVRSVFTPEERFGRGGSAKFDVRITPRVTGRMVRVVDDKTRLSYLNLHAVTDYETTTDIDLAGVVRTNFEFVRKLWVHRDIPGPWGIPVYFAYGPIVEAGGELALGATVNADFRHTADITFYPATVPYYLARMNPDARTLFQVTGVDQIVRAVNTFDHEVQNTRLDADWEYFAARGNITLGYAGRVGVAIPQHDVAWIGCEAQGGVKCDAEINMDFNDLDNAARDTRIYDALKNNSRLTVKPYWGIQAVISGLHDQVQVRFGRDDYTIFGSQWLNRGFLPIFGNTEATVSGGTSANVSSDITNDCLFPWTVGFSLFDENGNRVGEPQWNGQKYRLHQDFDFPFETTFNDMATDKNYKVFPTLRLFGLFNVLASPSADLDMHFPVTLSDFKVTSKQHKESGFTHNGQSYDYCFNVSITATLDDDATGITEWGYAYLDPNGNEALIPLMQFGRSKTDDRWAYYRNGMPPFTCTLYGYVKYVGSDEPVYGEPHDYSLEVEFCYDENHPHRVDLGLPSGTRWYCCNFGADKPEGWGGYYAFAELSEKNTYTLQNYLYYNYDYQFGGQYSYFENIGGNLQNFGICISGKRGFDVVTQNWGDEGRMPAKEEAQELIDCCTWTWTYRNEVPGYEVIGPNGNSIFLPASGQKAQTTNYQGDPNKLTHYRTGEWSSRQWGNQGLGYTWAIRFKQDSYELTDACAKAFGSVIRPVKSEDE